MTIIPLVTPLSDAPNRATDDDETFVTKANVTMSELVTMVDELGETIPAMNAVAGEVEANAESAAADAATAGAAAGAALNLSDLCRTSAANLTVGAGVKALTGLNLPSAAAFQNGDDVWLIRRGAADTRMRGQAGNVNPGAGTMDVTIGADGFAGSVGPHNDWFVIHGVFASLARGVAADLLLGTSAIAALTADAIYDALVEVALVDAATIALDMSTFINAGVTLGGNRTLGNPSNAKPGQTGRIRVVQDGTGGRTLSFASSWKRDGGAPSLSTAAGAIDFIDYEVIASNYIRYDISRSPS